MTSRALGPAMALVASLLFAADGAAARGRFDGTWIVDGATQVGACAPTFHGEVTIANDEVVATSAGGVDAIGAIAADGSVWARLTRSDGVARASGRFRGSGASGAWSSNTALCGGRWTARRKG